MFGGPRATRQPPGQSISRRSQELGLSATATWPILHWDWLGSRAVECGPKFGKKKNHFIDEADFWMNWWSKIVRLITIPIQLRYTATKCIPRKSLGPYFFQNETGIAITVNGQRYRSMISNFMWPTLVDMDTDYVRFQKDSATCHTTHTTIGLLHERFEGIWLSRAVAKIGRYNAF